MNYLVLLVRPARPLPHPQHAPLNLTASLSVFYHKNKKKRALSSVHQCTLLSEGLTNTRHRGNKTLAALKVSGKVHSDTSSSTKISKHFRRIIHTGKVQTSLISLLLTVKNQVAASLSLPPEKYPPTSVCKPRLYAHLRRISPQRSARYRR